MSEANDTTVATAPESPEKVTAPEVDEFAEYPENVRTTMKHYAETVEKMGKREKAELAAAAIQYQQMRSQLPKEDKPPAKPAVDDDDPIGSLKAQVEAMRAELKARDEREQQSRSNSERDARIKRALDSSPVTKDDPDLADTIYDAALAKSIRHGGTPESWVAKEIEKHQKRDAKRDSEYLTRKAKEADATRGEGGARSPGSKVIAVEMKGFKDSSFAQKVMEKRGIA